MDQQSKISTEVEIPEVLYNAAQDYLDKHPAWDQSRLHEAAMSLFLMQNGVNNPAVNSSYLESLFMFNTST